VARAGNARYAPTSLCANFLRANFPLRYTKFINAEGVCEFQPKVGTTLGKRFPH
jgi:hypothetical protein